jgi:hypothetical protein
VAKFGGRVFGKNKQGWRGKGQYNLVFNVPDHSKQEFHAAARASGFKLGDHYVMSDTNQHSETSVEQFDERGELARSFGYKHRQSYKNVDDYGSPTGHHQHNSRYERRDGHQITITKNGAWSHSTKDAKGKLGRVVTGKGLTRLQKHLSELHKEDKTLAPKTPVKFSYDSQHSEQHAERKANVFHSLFDQDVEDFERVVGAHGGKKVHTVDDSDGEVFSNHYHVPKSKLSSFKKRLADSGFHDGRHWGLVDSDQYSEQFAENTIGRLASSRGYTKQKELTRAGGTVYKHSDGHEIVHYRKDKYWNHNPKDTKAPKFQGEGLNSLSKYLDRFHGTQHSEEERLLDEEQDMQDPNEEGAVIVPAVETNPDMPPVMQDPNKMSAIKAALEQLDVVVPSDFSLADDRAPDILLTALNSALKAKQSAEVKAMMASQAQAGMAPLNEIPAQYREQFNAEEWQALPKNVKDKIVQFSEQERVKQINASKIGLETTIKTAHLPAGMKNELLSRVTTHQFSEAADLPTFDLSEVVQFMERHIPEGIRDMFGELKVAKQPVAGKLLGKDASGNNVISAGSSEQFFEGGETAGFGHISPEKAEEIFASNPLRGTTAGNKTPVTIQQTVHNINEQHPNNIMKRSKQ